MNGVSVGMKRIVVKAASFGRTKTVKYITRNDQGGREERKMAGNRGRQMESCMKDVSKEDQVVNGKVQVRIQAERVKMADNTLEPKEFRRAMEQVVERWMNPMRKEEGEGGKFVDSRTLEEEESVGDRESRKSRQEITKDPITRWDPLSAVIAAKEPPQTQRDVDNYYYGGEVLKFEKNPIMISCVTCMGNNVLAETNKGDDRLEIGQAQEDDADPILNMNGEGKGYGSREVLDCNENWATKEWVS
ncbi:hypothetical protein PIB30_006621 [Stylosanthes scabra]|uniref:Uncharacterized protein n=1 Tax=Stylosanthes scabra TaxID=79078 RepID=A0ABU6Q576_9FABA|nr:hypothetical protein [Stylosanthes scabra]